MPRLEPVQMIEHADQCVLHDVLCVGEVARVRRQTPVRPPEQQRRAALEDLCGGTCIALLGQGQQIHSDGERPDVVQRDIARGDRAASATNV